MITDESTSSFLEKPFSRRKYFHLMAAVSAVMVGAATRPAYAETDTPDDSDSADAASTKNHYQIENNLDSSNQEFIPTITVSQEQKQLIDTLSLGLLNLGMATIIPWKKAVDNQDVLNSYKKTMILGALEMIGRALVTYTLSKVSSKQIGNSNSKVVAENIEKHFVNGLLTSGVLAPLIEELIFRILPSRIINSKGLEGIQWKTGIPIAVAFALVHNLTNDEKDNSTFSTDYIPLPQFIGGIYYWYVVRMYGEGQAVVAHTQNNLTVLGLLFGQKLLKWYP